MIYTIQNPEISIIAINSILIFFSYFLIYPRFVKSSFNKLLAFDILLSLLALTIAGFIFYQAEVEFNALLFKTNWFWFSLLTYFIIESIALPLYKNKFNVPLSNYSMSNSQKSKNKIVANTLPNTLKYMKYVITFHLIIYLSLVAWTLMSGESFQLLWGIHIVAVVSIFLASEYPRDKFTFFLQLQYLILMPSIFIYRFIKSIDICDSSITCSLVGFGPSVLLYIALLLLLLGKDYYFKNEIRA